MSFDTANCIRFFEQKTFRKMNGKKMLLVCGVIAPVWYLFMNIITAMLYEGYNSASQVVSELSAIGAPTRPLWVWLVVVYALLMIAFGWGVRQSAGGNRYLRIAGILLMISTFIGMFWPPMHRREVLAAGGGDLSDTLHIAFTAVCVPLAMLAYGFAAAALGKRFRFYSIATIAIMTGFGVLTGLDSPGMEANEPTPRIGVWERIGIAAQMLWVIVLAVVLLRREKSRLP